MRGKRLAERRQKNRDLAALDRSNRCHQCKVSLIGKVRYTTLDGKLEFCGHDCVADYLAGGAARGQA